MAVIVTALEPKKLLGEIKEAIDSGKVTTWEYDKDGDFTRKLEKWRFAAWFRPQVVSDRIRFLILSPENKYLTKEVYATYHSSLINMLLMHFDERFMSARATALPLSSEVVGPPQTTERA